MAAQVTLFDELIALPEGEVPAQRRASHPKGWEPGIRYDGETRVITTPPVEQLGAQIDDADVQGLYADLIATMGQAVPPGYRIRLAEAKYDPAAWTREGQGEDAVTAKVWRYRFIVEPLAVVDEVHHWSNEDFQALLAQVRRHKAPKPRVATGDPQAFCVFIADWQLGKADGDGTEGIVGRVLEAIESVEARVAELRRQGRNLESLYVFGLGDIIESCDGHYAQQAWRTQLTLTQQIRLARQLIAKALMRWAKLFERVVVPVVQGNHGEVRKDGKSFTDFADNFDTDVFKAAAEVLDANPEAFGHVTFMFPQGQELTLTVDVYGTVVGLAHGHQYNLKQIEKWLAGQALGRQPIGDCDILVTGHYHHFLSQPLGKRRHFQCPALDGGSDWFRHLSGADDQPGVLTMVIGAGGWRDLAIL